MKLVVDSGAWIEWFANESLAESVAPHLSDERSLLVPTLVLFETHKWLARERSDAVADAASAALRTLHVMPLDVATALHASALAREHRLPTADAIILAHARGSSARLLTLDHHLGDFPEAIYIPKGGRVPP